MRSNIDFHRFIDWLHNRLQKNLPGVEAQTKMASFYRKVIQPIPEHARQSGVLLTLFVKNEKLHIVIIERTKNGGVHSGQLAFPGGQKEAGDSDIIQTALRETNEEVGIISDEVLILGKLTELYIPVSNFVIYPVVGFCAKIPVLIPSDDEVSSVFTYPLAQLFNNKGNQTASVVYNGIAMTIETIAYNLPDGKYIWGATAMILSELETLWLEYLEE